MRITEVAKNNLKTMFGIVSKEKYQAGYPNWRGQTVLKLPLEPGAQKGVTWCNEAAYEIIKVLGYDPKPFLNPKGIGWTNANDFYKNAWKAVLAKKVERIPESIGQQLANRGDVILLISHSLINGSGHVAVIAPNEEAYIYDRGCRIIQAGAKNGEFWRAEIFNLAEITPPLIVKCKR